MDKLFDRIINLFNTKCRYVGF